MSRLFLLFVGVPLLELFLLVQVGQAVGVWPTIGLVVTTGLGGAALARLEGLRTVMKLRGELARGRLPGDALFDGLAILLGGALLLTPGILTDILGFSFLIPFTRRRLLAGIRKSLERRLQSGSLRVEYFGESSGGVSGGWFHEGVGGDRPGESPGEIVVEPKDGASH